MRLVGRGHPAIRATHHKTLELTPDDDVSERATCVVAVGLARAATPLAGDLRLVLSAGTESFAFEARANPAWQPGDPAVIRRSPLRLPGTFATHASAAAGDLPATLVAALREPTAVVDLHVEHAPTQRPRAVLYALDSTRGADASLAAELAAADVVVAEDDVAARAVGGRVTRDPQPVTGRVLVVAAHELPGRSVAAALRDVDIETVGLPPLLAAAAASPSRAPLTMGDSDADARTVLRAAPAASRVALVVPGEQVAAVLRFANEARGTGDAVLVQPYAPPVRIDADHPPPVSKEPAYLCFDAVAHDDVLDPQVRAAIDALLADGVATKTAAAALAALTGWERRRAYDVVLSWPGRR